MPQGSIPRDDLVAIVDDDPSVCRSARRLLRSLGYEAVAFRSAEELLGSGSLARTTCLILDVRMPRIDGLELQHRLAADGWRIPIVFITARASDEEERRAREAGAVAFLRKPVEKQALLRALDAATERSSCRSGTKDAQ